MIFAQEAVLAYQNPDRPPTVKVNMRMMVPMIGIVLAPFIGLLYSAEAGLIILILCLAGMAWTTWNVASQVPPAQAKPLKFGAILNAVLAVGALALLLLRL